MKTFTVKKNICHSGGEWQPKKDPHFAESQPWEASPGLSAPAHYVHNLGQSRGPSREVKGHSRASGAPRQDIDKKPKHGNVRDKRHNVDPCKHVNLALSLKELLGWEVYGQWEQLRDYLDVELSGEVGDTVVLAEQL